MDDGHEHNFVALPLHHSYVSLIDGGRSFHPGPLKVRESSSLI
jgi:hypothetical protein